MPLERNLAWPAVLGAAAAASSRSRSSCRWSSCSPGRCGSRASRRRGRRSSSPTPSSPATTREAFDLVGLGRATLNSFLVAALVGAAGRRSSPPARGSRSSLLPPRRARTLLLAVSLAALMVPLTALLVPRFALFRSLGLVDTFVPLVAPALLGTSPFYVLVFYVAFRRIPPELYDACRLEGLRRCRSGGALAMPLVRPVTVGRRRCSPSSSPGANFLDPLVYLFDRDLFTAAARAALARAARSDELPAAARGRRARDRCRCSSRSSSPSATSSTSTAAPAGSDDEPPVARRRRSASEYGGIRRARGLDLEVADGELLVVLGPSGCGKSTRAPRSSPVSRRRATARS